MGPVLKYLCELAGVHPGPRTPDGVFAREVDGRTLYVNTTGEVNAFRSRETGKD